MKIEGLDDAEFDALRSKVDRARQDYHAGTPSVPDSTYDMWNAQLAYEESKRGMQTGGQGL